MTHVATSVSGVQRSDWTSAYVMLCSPRRSRHLSPGCLLQYHWLYSLRRAFYPWGIVVFKFRLSRSWAINPTTFCRRKILGSTSELLTTEAFTDGRPLSVSGWSPLLSALMSSTGLWPQEPVSMGRQWVARHQTQRAGPHPRSDSVGSEGVFQLWFISWPSPKGILMSCQARGPPSWWNEMELEVRVPGDVSTAWRPVTSCVTLGKSSLLHFLNLKAECLLYPVTLRNIWDAMYNLETVKCWRHVTYANSFANEGPYCWEFTHLTNMWWQEQTDQGCGLCSGLWRMQGLLLEIWLLQVMASFAHGQKQEARGWVILERQPPSRNLETPLHHFYN